MANSIQELTPQELMNYMNRVVQKHTSATREVKEACTLRARKYHAQRAESLQALFTEARILAHKQGYTIWH